MAGKSTARRLWITRVLATLALTGLGLSACHGQAPTASGRASMSVSGAAALLDAPVTVSVRGLPADAATTISASAVDAGGTTWTSSAQFRASSAGMVTLGQASLGGSYSGVNPMGLFEFMNPPMSDLKDTRFSASGTGYDVQLHASVGGEQLASVSTRRQTPAAFGVRESDLRPARGGLYGDLYLPATTSGKHPAVLVFGGSEGELGVTLSAALLAVHGYPSLALAYFNEPGLPHTLTDIPLEYFTKALSVLRAQPGVDPKHVLVFGVSRGGELALILGSHFPQLVNGVIAGVPSSVVNGGLPSGYAWTLQGKPLPTVRDADYGKPAPTDDRQAIIAVERISGPILLTCGGQDMEWPSCPYTDAITARLKASHFSHPVTALHYPDAGHKAGIMNAFFSSTINDSPELGGTLAANKAAEADGHLKLLAFLAAQ